MSSGHRLACRVCRSGTRTCALLCWELEAKQGVAFSWKRGIFVCVHLCAPVPKQACADPGTVNQGVTVMLGER